MMVEKLRNGRHDPLLVGTINEQDSRVFHAVVPHSFIRSHSPQENPSSNHFTRMPHSQLASE
jgi:hypothetical protein